MICCVKNLKVHKKWEGDDVNLKYGQPPSLCTGACFAPVVGFPALCFDCMISRACHLLQGFSLNSDWLVIHVCCDWLDVICLAYDSRRKIFH